MVLSKMYGSEFSWQESRSHSKYKLCLNKGSITFLAFLRLSEACIYRALVKYEIIKVRANITRATTYLRKWVSEPKMSTS